MLHLEAFIYEIRRDAVWTVNSSIAQWYRLNSADWEPNLNIIHGTYLSHFLCMFPYMPGYSQVTFVLIYHQNEPCSCLKKKNIYMDSSIRLKLIKSVNKYRECFGWPYQRYHRLYKYHSFHIFKNVKHPRWICMWSMKFHF